MVMPFNSSASGDVTWSRFPVLAPASDVAAWPHGSLDRTRTEQQTTACLSRWLQAEVSWLHKSKANSVDGFELSRSYSVHLGYYCAAKDGMPQARGWQRGRTERKRW